MVDKKVTEFIDRLFKRKKKSATNANPTTSSISTSSTKSATTTKIKKDIGPIYGAGRDSNGKPYTRVDRDPNRMNESDFADAAAGKARVRNLEDSLKQQINQMYLYTIRLAHDICNAELHLGEYITKIGKNLSNDDKMLRKAMSVQDAIDSLVRDAEELDAYIEGLNEMIDEYKQSGGNMMDIHTYTNGYIDKTIANLNTLKKYSTNILNVITNNAGNISGDLSKITDELTKATSNAIKVTEKVVAIFEKI